MLDVREIGHRYGTHWALDSVTFEATSGIVAVLGRNGAGKSTLLRILATLMLPTAGALRFRGTDMLENPEALRRATAYLPQDMAFPPDVSALDYVNYLLALRGSSRDRSTFWLTELGLGRMMRDRLRSYSGGMRQRVGLAYALACDAEILLLDEPTQGLDPWERIRFHQQLAHLAADRLILFSTHIISDIEAIAGRVIVLDGGKISFDGSPTEMVAAPRVEVWQLTRAGAVESVEGRTITGMRRLPSGLIETRGVGKPPEGAEAVTPTLQDSYLYLTDQRRSDA